MKQSCHQLTLCRTYVPRFLFRSRGKWRPSSGKLTQQLVYSEREQALGRPQHREATRIGCGWFQAHASADTIVLPRCPATHSKPRPQLLPCAHVRVVLQAPRKERMSTPVFVSEQTDRSVRRYDLRRIVTFFHETRPCTPASCIWQVMFRLNRPNVSSEETECFVQTDQLFRPNRPTDRSERET